MRRLSRSLNIQRSFPRETVEGPLSEFAGILHIIQQSIMDEGGWSDFPVLTPQEYEEYLSNPRTAYDVAGWILHSHWGAMSDLWGGWRNRPIDYQTWKYVRARLIRMRNECTEMGMKGRYTSYPPSDYDAYKAIGRTHGPTVKVTETAEKVYGSMKNPQFTYTVERNYGRPFLFFIDRRLKGEDWTDDPGVFAYLTVENQGHAYFRVGSRSAAQYRWDMVVNEGNLSEVVSNAFMSATEVHKELAQQDPRLTSSDSNKVNEIGMNLRAIVDSLQGIVCDHVDVDSDPLTFTVRINREGTSEEFATAVIGQTKTGWNLVYRPYDADLIIRSCADINKVYARFEDTITDRLMKENRKKSVPKAEPPRKEAPMKEVKPKSTPKATPTGKTVYEVRLNGKMKAQFGSKKKAEDYVKELKAQGLKPGVVKVEA